MSKKPIPVRMMAVLVTVAVVLTVAMTVVLVAGHIFGKMGDGGGQVAMDRIAIGIGILWVIDLVCLVFSLGVNSLGGDS